MAKIDLKAADGHELGAYEVHPDGARAAVVIVQEIFGVNPHIRSVVDRYAARGYHAVAPAIFDRAERGVELEYTAEGVQEGIAIRGRIPWEETMADVAAAVERATATGPVAVVGYCFGGSVAWRAAHSLPVSAAVGYYGGAIAEFIDEDPKVPVMLHFGADDQAIPLTIAEEVRERYPQVEVFVYEGAGHGFNCDARESYAPGAAALAQERTLDFLARAGVRP